MKYRKFKLSNLDNFEKMKVFYYDRLQSYFLESINATNSKTLVIVAIDLNVNNAKEMAEKFLKINPELLT